MTVGAAVVPTANVTLSQLQAYCTNVGAGAGGVRVAVYSSAFALLASSISALPVSGVTTHALSSTLALTKGTLYYFAIFANRAGVSFKLFTPTGETLPAISWFDSTTGGLWPGGGSPEGYFDPFWMNGVAA